MRIGLYDNIYIYIYIYIVFDNDRKNKSYFGLSLYIYIDLNKIHFFLDVLSLTIIVAKNKIGNLNSNPGLGWLCFTLR